MKFPEHFDFTQLFTLLGFISSLIIWGIKLERQVSDNRAGVRTFQSIQEVRWEENGRRLDALRRDISRIEGHLQNKQPER